MASHIPQDMPPVTSVQAEAATAQIAQSFAKVTLPPGQQLEQLGAKLNQLQQTHTQARSDASAGTVAQWSYLAFLSGFGALLTAGVMFLDALSIISAPFIAAAAAIERGIDSLRGKETNKSDNFLKDWAANTCPFLQKWYNLSDNETLARTTQHEIHQVRDQIRRLQAEISRENALKDFNQTLSEPSRSNMSIGANRGSQPGDVEDLVEPSNEGSIEPPPSLTISEPSKTAIDVEPYNDSEPGEAGDDEVLDSPIDPSTLHDVDLEGPPAPPATSSKPNG